MAPLRRYLRITKHSVLEVRIYLDRPADADAWLLRRDDPALPRVIQAVRPLVLPKLREENERSKGKGGAKAKKKGVKDVVIEDDFEVSIFLTELSSRHSVLTKQKSFKDKARIQSNSGKLTNWLTAGTSDQPVLITEEATEPIVIREEEDEDAMDINNIPDADEPRVQTRRSARDKRPAEEFDQDAVDIGSDSDSSALFVPAGATRLTKSTGKAVQANKDDDGVQDGKKKLRLNTSYDGFSIYGRILCLVVKRRGARTGGGTGAPASSQQMLENWVSTQAAAEQVDDDEDAG
ncbi:hypothetical protein GQ44DRAFT_714506 [Phaeosphaeriaceae sp. PMI808]|nr:hypothetical protein GQ44DRAFT_714506 [Phaeosphaeriaceae sp. PMI808]